MKNEKEYKKWIDAMFNKYSPILFLMAYHLTSELKKDDESHYLSSEFNFPYYDIKIWYSERAINDWMKNKIDAERRMIHEFCHTITDEFYEAALRRFINKEDLNDKRESLTDHIAQIVNKHFNLM